MIDLNSDLGESFGSWRMGDDEALLEVVSSANVACGFHAGDPLTMLRTARVAAERGVAVGAHPGYRDLAGFGRRAIDASAEEVYGDVLYQLAALDGILQTVGTRVAYVKPHGALYHRIGHDRDQAAAVCAAVRDFRAGLPVLGLNGTQIQQACIAAEVPFYQEAFVDRGYTPGGGLVPRDQPGAILHDVAEIAARAVRMVTERRVTATDGTEIEVRPDSLCVHGDTPGAVAMARAVRESLDQAGVPVGPFSS
ncbi:LamB/YcsF family protein [Acaricomes phytoseiuli]|uniref:LamB/YcsF family protein n=1 Tax=Acaricomes phytoseiuli TaxID=291968 RepID=UPI000378B0B8|nr:5-oxoprolinase subunit PxpA [Acaricomes phytoseiuli]MCW1250391.1 LamB/YcsF family protein [Acaricomes phytoseiuli]